MDNGRYSSRQPPHIWPLPRARSTYFSTCGRRLSDESAVFIEFEVLPPSLDRCEGSSLARLRTLCPPPSHSPEHFSMHKRASSPFLYRSRTLSGQRQFFSSLPCVCTGSSKINGAKLSDACSVRANWLCMGWPFCWAEMRREFQTGGKFFCITLYTKFNHY